MPKVVEKSGNTANIYDFFKAKTCRRPRSRLKFSINSGLTCTKLGTKEKRAGKLHEEQQPQAR